MSYLKYDGSTAVETAPPVASNFGTSAVETLTGGSGAEGLYGSDRDTLIGGAGDDTYYFQGNNISVVEAASAGVDKIVAWQNVNLAKTPNVENLEVGGNGAPGVYGAGNQLDNLIVANGSLQQLYGGAGQDVLVGSASGADTFIVIKGEGNDALYNFDPAKDVLRLSAGYTSFGQVQSHMTQVGGDVKIDLGGTDALILRNVASSQLTAANFQLQLDPAKLAPLTFHDEFNDAQLSIWDGESNPSGVWRPDYGYAGSQGTTSYTLASNGEQQIYVSPYFRDAPGNYALTPFSESGGALTITAQPAPANAADLWGYHYTSGMITTKETFAQTYGYFEMRAELPQNAGGWPAFWLLPADGSWPPELDVMETLTKDPSADYTTSHSNVGNTHSMSQGVSFIPQTSDGFHTYGVLWTASTLTWYVDGVQVFATATPADMNKPMYMLANLALGGWGGSVDDAQLPAQMKIDYIRAYGLADGSSSVAYDKAASGGGTAAPTDPTPPPPSSPPPPPTVPATPSGAILTAAPGGTLAGGAGADTLNGSAAGGDKLTGGAGYDTFAFAKVPGKLTHITDFTPGVDRLDLSKVLAGYTGADPIKDKYVILASDGAGGTKISIDIDGPGRTKAVAAIDLDGVASGGLTASKLFTAIPPAPPAGSPTSGETLTSLSAGTVIVGGAGADTITASTANDSLTGGGGADVFVFGKEPSSPIHITDFQVGVDKIDLTPLLKAYGYTGSDPLADKWIALASDGAGGTMVRFDHDGAGPNPLSPKAIIDLDKVSPAGVTWAQLSGAPAPAPAADPLPPPPSTTAGQLLTSPGPSSVLTGGAGADTLIGSMGYDTVTGGAGADHFVLSQEPWAPMYVTDFQVGVDVLDLSALFQKSGYTGSDPVADGYVYLLSDGADGTIVRFDRDGTGSNPVWPNTIVDLQHVSPVGLTWAKLEAGWIAA